MRPKYETQKDRARERAVLDVLEEKWRCRAVTAPDFSVYDAILYRGEIPKGVVEIKCRSQAYRTLWISKAKVDRIVAACEKAPARVLPILVVDLPDKILGLELQPNRYGVVRGGRTDRGDPADVEPCYEISWQAFNRIHQKQKETA